MKRNDYEGIRIPDKDAKKQPPAKYESFKEAENNRKNAEKGLADLGHEIGNIVAALEAERPGVKIEGLEPSSQYFILTFPDGGRVRQFNYMKNKETTVVNPETKESGSIPTEQAMAAKVLFPNENLYKVLHSAEFKEFWKKYEEKKKEGANNNGPIV